MISDVWWWEDGSSRPFSVAVDWDRKYLLRNLGGETALCQSGASFCQQTVGPKISLDNNVISSVLGLFGPSWGPRHMASRMAFVADHPS